jgi:hypothetical protein
VQRNDGALLLIGADRGRRPFAAKRAIGDIGLGQAERCVNAADLPDIRHRPVRLAWHWRR